MPLYLCCLIMERSTLPQCQYLSYWAFPLSGTNLFFLRR